ncbi:MAG: hypothetical protein HRU34_19385 [Richelia sp.]|nr:hypothetical protein [Richelia sp.]
MGIYFKRYFTITIAAILSIAIASCSSGEEQQSSAPPAPESVPKKTKKPTYQPFKDPVVPGDKVFQPIVSTASNLIQATNAKEREALVPKGRSDPFAQITGQVVPTLNRSVRGTKNKPVPSLPRLRTLKLKVPTSSPLGPVAKPRSTTSAKKPTLNPVLPPPPKPEIAEAVVVSGVVVIGSTPKAIIKVPDEPTTRYVEAGQRLGNGLLIKRIEMNEASEPTVILEQFGIEVAKMVGETSSDPKSDEASTETKTSSKVSKSGTI